MNRRRRAFTRKNKRSTVAAGRRLTSERLEDRRMLSISVPSYRYTIDGTGANPNESILTPANVISTAHGGSFGKQFSIAVDGQVLAEPLYMASLTMTATPNGSANVLVSVPTNAQNTAHNVVFVATEHDSVYAIDATTGQVLWQDAFINGTTITTVPSGDVNSGDITPEIGITGTPAIDPNTNFLYVVVETKESESTQYTAANTPTPHYLAILEKIDIQNGSNTSVVIADTTYAGGAYTYNSGPYVYGTGDGSIDVGGRSVVYFNALRQMFRPGILIDNGQVILGSASHGDNGPYHGWMLTYNETTLALTGVLNTTPNGGLGGIWQGDGAIVVDPQGYFYFETGNGSFNQNASNFSSSYTSDGDELPLDADYGDSFVKVAIDTSTNQGSQGPNGWGLTVADYFTPKDQANLNAGDVDLGSGGPIVLPASVGSAQFPDLLMGGGKEGEIYLLDRDHMGGFSTTDAGVVQEQVGAVAGILSVPAYFDGDIYYTSGYNGNYQGISEYSISNARFSTTPVSQTPEAFSNLDGGPVVTSDGSVNGIVWALDRGTGQLRAYSAANLSDELYTSAQAANNADAVGSVMKYTSPTVANGQVFVGTGSALVVYGLPIVPTQPPTAPTSLVANISAATAIALSWTDPDFTAAAYDIERSTDDVNWTQIGQAAADSTSYEDTTAQPLTTYHYRVRGSNSVGYSAYTNVATVTTPGEQTIGTGDGLFGQYYSGTNINFSTATPAFTRVDPTIDVNWGSTGPGSPLGTSNYSVQWTGELQAQYSQAYTFYTTSSDGIRLIVNGQTLINDYNDHGPTVDTSTSIDLAAGQSYTIQIQYFDDTGSGEAVLEWSSASTPEEIVPQSQLFSGAAPAAPVLATPVAASGSQVNLSWTESSDYENGFEIDRKVGADGTYTEIAVVNPSVTTYMDTGLTQDVTYYYEVRALNFEADSAFSNEESILTPEPPPTPSDATPTTITTTSISMTWVNDATDATVTRILRGAAGSGGNFIFVAALPPTATSYTDNGPNGAGLTPGVSYDYHIQVGNQAGYSDFTGFTIQTLTTPPTQLIAVGGDGQVTLAWNAPSGSQTFNIYRATSSGGEVQVATGVTGDTLIDTGLSNGQTYYYEMTSVDTGGESAPSSEASATPLVPTSKSSPPTNVTATAGDTKATLQWIAAEGAASYNIYRGTASGQETLLQSGITTTSFLDTGLTNGTTYYYQVTSVNSLGEGAPSTEISVSPHTLPPPTPINVTATAGDSAVGLSWTAASDASSYNIYRSTDSGDEVLYQQGVLGTSYNDTGVTNGVTYYYQVSAANGVGESNLSIEVTATPLPPLPATPTSLIATALNANQIELQWHESATSLTGFEILRSTNDVNFSLVTTLDPTATSYIDSSNLAVGTYYYQIVAVNLAGDSGTSNTAHATLVAQLPAPWTDTDIGGPTYAGSASYSGGGVVNVSGGGSGIWYSADQFNYFYQSLNGDGTIIAQVLSQGNTNPWAMAGVMIRNSITNTGSTYADMVLTPGNGAAFQYRATADTSNLGNDQGGGSTPDWVELTRSGSTITGYVSADGLHWTEVGSYTFAPGALNTQVYIGLAVTAFSNTKLSNATFANVSISGQTIPAAPINPTATALSGTAVTLQWQDTGSATVDYNYIYRMNPGAPVYTLIATVPGNVSTFTDTGLTSGDTYSYQVVAANTIGNSTQATTSVTLPVLPLDPTVLQPNSITATSAGLSWVLNSSNDTGVDVYQRVGNATTFTLIATLPAGSTAYNVTGLQPGTVYEYQVSAVDLVGQSGFADTGFTTLPAAPADFMATAGSSSITLDWQAVTGALIYNVYRGLSPGGEGENPYASGLTSPTFVDNGVNPNTTYYYTVTAADFSGESAQSAEVNTSIVEPLVVVGNNLVLGDGTNLTVNSVNANTLTIGAGSTLTIAPSGPGISTGTGATSSQPGLVASTATTTSDSSDSNSDSASNALADVQAAIASGSISSLAGQQLENRINAIERLAATDPGLDVSMLISRVLTVAGVPALPSPSVGSSTVASSNAVIAPAVVAPDVAGPSVAISTSTVAAAPPVVQAPPVIQPPIDNDVSAVATTTIVTISPAAPTASDSPVLAQPTIATAAVAPEAAFVSSPVSPRAIPSKAFEPVALAFSPLPFDAAIPTFLQIATGQTLDQLSSSIVATPSNVSTDAVTGLGTANASQPASIAAVATGVEDVFKGDSSAGAADARSIHEAIDAILADGDNAVSSLDDALLNLLADAAGNRS